MAKVDGSNILPQSLDNYAKEWYDMMAVIWKDRIKLLGIIDTYRLYNELKKTSYIMSRDSFQMDFQFVKYGIYVDSGTGNGYYRGNPGDLEFLDKSYRFEHHLGKPREPRPWFSVSWYISVSILKEKVGDMMGDAFTGLFDNL